MTSTQLYDRWAPVSLEASHRPRFQWAVVTLDTIILVLLGVVEYVGDLFFDHGLQRLSRISDHLHRIAMSGQGLLKNRRAAGILCRLET